MHRTVLAAAAILALGAAQAQSRTYVKLAGKHDELPKLGLPGITVGVLGPSVEEASAVRDEIARSLGEIVHTRALAPGEPGDYSLSVTLASALAGLGAGTIPFEAVLKGADGRTLWHVVGHTDVEGAGDAAEPLVSIGRNVVAALVHDGWVAPRYDPENPPPPPPTIRRVAAPGIDG